MMKLTIDYIPLEVKEGTTLMQAAAMAGIKIPSMCYLEELPNHPSCMVCMVKDLSRNRFLPSCSYLAEEGMNILTHSPEIRGFRKEALELLLSDHAGDCDAPCQRSCPASMDIPGMNRLIAAGRFEEALSRIREEIAIPLVLGYICPAPCENACHRSSIDGPVSICLLKRFTAQDKLRRGHNLLPMVGLSGKKVAIVGSGPAGLSAAFYLLRSGHTCVIYDQHLLPGGMLRYKIPENRLPRKALDAEIQCIRQMGAIFTMDHPIDKLVFHQELCRDYDAVILATGNEEKQILEDFGLEVDEHGVKVSLTHFTTSAPRIFACGNMIRKRQMAVRSAAQGKAAAISANHFLMTGKPLGSKHLFNSSFGRLQKEEFEDYLMESGSVKRVEPENGSFGGFTREEAIREAGRCMHCDCRKQVTCKLRQYAGEYGTHQKHFAGPSRKKITKLFRQDLVVYEPEKCIRCGLCVQITQMAGEDLGLTYIGRGFDVRIGIPFHQSFDEALKKTASACVKACPTGALSGKEDPGTDTHGSY
ncbi:MAG: FAD-dependent oxidoreductase [Bacteroidales bacterium]|nr:FAD-dependent oxidoreductase [Bacteroidales bacterium]